MTKATINAQPLTATQRQQKLRAERAEAGGYLLSVWLDADAAAKLDGWRARGETVQGITNKLFRRSKP